MYSVSNNGENGEIRGCVDRDQDFQGLLRVSISKEFGVIFDLLMFFGERRRNMCFASFFVFSSYFDSMNFVF